MNFHKLCLKEFIGSLTSAATKHQHNVTSPTFRVSSTLLISSPPCQWGPSPVAPAFIVLSAVQVRACVLRWQQHPHGLVMGGTSQKKTWVFRCKQPSSYWSNPVLPLFFFGHLHIIHAYMIIYDKSC